MTDCTVKIEFQDIPGLQFKTQKLPMLESARSVKISAKITEACRLLEMKQGGGKKKKISRGAKDIFEFKEGYLGLFYKKGTIIFGLVTTRLCEITASNRRVPMMLYSDRFCGRKAHSRARFVVELPEDIGEIINEKGILDVDFSNNFIETIPKSLKLCKELQTIDFNRNMIKTVPKELGECEKLEKLNLASNEITELPEELNKLNKLRTLNLKQNKIVKLPYSYYQLEEYNLVELQLFQNPLKDPPPRIVGRGLTEMCKYMKAKSMNA